MRNADAVSALERDLRTIFGSRLQSLVAYGVESSADGPVTTLAIVEQLAAADLQACAHRVASWRVRGLGRQLVDLRLQLIDRERWRHVLLRTSAVRNTSYEMYRKMGFEDTGVYMEVPARRVDGTTKTDRRLFLSMVL